MNSEPLQRWADNAAYTAGRALHQGKDFFNSTFSTAREKAIEAARRGEKLRRKEAKRAKAYLPALQGRWDSFVDHASDHFSRAGSHLHDRFHHTERTLLKVGALFLIFKAFSHRNQPVNEIAHEARVRIEERPIESALLAIGIGYALGKLLR